MGSGSKLIRGEILYASSLNSINGQATYSGTMPSGADEISDYLPNNGYIYSHRPSGQLLFTAHFECGIFGGGNFRAQQYINGSWNTICSEDMSWNTDKTVNVYSNGPGYYRFYSDTNFQFESIPWSLYCGDNGISKGDYLTIYDDFTLSSDSLKDTPITAILINTQRCGRK